MPSHIGHLLLLVMEGFNRYVASLSDAQYYAISHDGWEGATGSSSDSNIVRPVDVVKPHIALKKTVSKRRNRAAGQETQTTLWAAEKRQSAESRNSSNSRVLAPDRGSQARIYGRRDMSTMR